MASDVLYLSLSNGTYLGSIGISGGHFEIHWQEDSGLVADSVSCIVQSANEGGLHVRESRELDGQTIELLHDINIYDKGALAALRDRINSADWLHPRCFASFLNPLAEDRSHGIYLDNRICTNGLPQRKVYDCDINIPTLMLPAHVRYATINGGNFKGFAIRYGATSSETPYEVENRLPETHWSSVG